MLAALAALAFDVILWTPSPVDVNQVLASYKSQCAGAAASSPDCKKLQWQLESILYDDLRAGAPADHRTWRAAAGADVPLLAVIGLQNLGDQYDPAADDGVLELQLDSPFGMVRQAAWNLAERTKNALSVRARDRRVMRTIADYPVEDPLPTPEQLAIQVYPGATYRYFASDDGRAYYTTDDSPDKVAAFYAKGGTKVLGPADLKAEQAKRKAALAAMQKDPMAAARKMQEAIKAGKSPQEAAAAMTANIGGADRDWMQGLASDKGVVDPRFVPLDEGMARMMLFFKDEALGKTAIVWVDMPNPATLAGMKLMMSSKPEDRKRMMDGIKAQQFLGQPLVDSGQ